MSKQVAGQLNYRSVERLEQYPVQEKSNQSVEHLQVDAVSVPLENISIRRCLAVFRFDYWEKRCAEPLTLEPDQFDKVVLRVLVNKVVGAILPSFGTILRTQRSPPSGLRCRVA